ncbi:MAG TPA: hypothetical protein ENN67_02050, partial [Firmicutes bacterium]|nr:hypothetical protein [Bacillota bacterium]
MSDAPESKTRIIFSGPPGSGKTRCLIDIFNHARKEHREDRILFLVPDSNSREHLRDTIARFAPIDVPSAFSDSGIHTTYSLIRTIAGNSSSNPAHIRAFVDKWVKNVDLDSVLNPILQTPGGRSSLAGAINTLRSHGYDSAKLAYTGEDVVPLDSILLKAMKLWEKWLRDFNHTDELDILSLALDRREFPVWNTVLIDGFTEIHDLQWRIVQALIESSETAAVSLDPDLYPSGALLEKFKSIGFTEKKLNKSARWNTGCTLEWFSGINSWTVDSPEPEFPCPTSSCDELLFIEAADPRIEAASIVRQITACVRNGFSYSEIA